MPKELERKFRSLSDFKSVSEGAGGYKGYATVWDEIDESGDLIARGAYLDTIPNFLSKGFGAHSHDWNFSESIGYPVDAQEDEQGFLIEQKFHSTADAQQIRVKAQERIADGKTVGLSIGWQPAEPPVFIYPKDYAKDLAKYVSPDSLARVLDRAKQFPRVRVLPKIDLYEVSIVTAPMLKAAEVTEIKSNDMPNVKGLFEDRLTERTNSFCNLCETLSFVIFHIQYMAVTAQETGTVFDAQGLLDEALVEFTSRVRSSFLSHLESSETWDAYYYMGAISKLVSVKASVSDKPLDEHSETVVSALTEFAQLSTAIQEPIKAWLKRSTDKQEYRTKEGRTISQATANKITTAKTQIDDAVPALETVSSALSDLLELATPKEKVSPEVANALRTQSLRAQSRAWI